MKCERCGQVLEADGAVDPAAPSGIFVSDGTQWEDEDCGHCHLCLYDKCEVFLRHCHWLCARCAAVVDC